MNSHLFKYRLKPGSESVVKEWAKFANEHREGILELLKDEGIHVEDAFIERIGTEMYLYYYVRTDDLEHALEVFASSKNPLDDYHKEFLQKVIDTKAELEKIVGLELAGV